MSRLLEWFDITPWRQKVSLVSLVMVLFGGAFYWLIAEPIMEETAALLVELQTVDGQLTRASHSESQYRHAQQELSQWTLIVARQEERLGLEVPMSQVLADMSNIAEEIGMIVTLWKPDDVPSTSLNQNTVRHLQLHMEGGYHHLARFLDHMQDLSKTMGVTGLSMARADTDDGMATILATIDLIGYEGPVHTQASHHNRLAPHRM